MKRTNLGAVVFKSHAAKVDMEYVNLQELKSWVHRRFPQNNAVRAAVESQPDQLSTEEFLVLLKMLDLMLVPR